MMRLIIHGWRPTLGQMARGKQIYQVRIIGREGLEIVAWRQIEARTWKGAVRKIQAWAEWEGYEVDGCTVEVKEVCDAI